MKEAIKAGTILHPEFQKALWRLGDMRGPNNQMQEGLKYLKNIPRLDNRTLLIEAAALGVVPLVKKLLLDSRLNVNATDHAG